MHNQQSYSINNLVIKSSKASLKRFMRETIWTHTITQTQNVFRFQEPVTRGLILRRTKPQCLGASNMPALCYWRAMPVFTDDLKRPFLKDCFLLRENFYRSDRSSDYWGKGKSPAGISLIVRSAKGHRGTCDVEPWWNTMGKNSKSHSNSVCIWWSQLCTTCDQWVWSQGQGYSSGRCRHFAI